MRHLDSNEKTFPLTNIERPNIQTVLRLRWVLQISSWGDTEDDVRNKRDFKLVPFSSGHLSPRSLVILDSTDRIAITPVNMYMSDCMIIVGDGTSVPGGDEKGKKLGRETTGRE